ncbi:MAG: hypothetical protein GY743_08450 [Planctomycetaceae bacterium]|nr:hypothetical protein [Planctomycetaceae bacterium]
MEPTRIEKGRRSVTRPITAPGVTGQYAQMDGDRAYCISNSHLMPEFFMTLVSSSDHWMFISSHGALTTGRTNANSALFPYYSADKIADMRHCTGTLTVLRVRDKDGTEQLWQPFSPQWVNDPQLVRNLYKNDFGNKLWFEEINESLGLCFRYRWTFGDRFGMIRSCEIQNLTNEPRTIELLDGLQNILPCGIDQFFQLRFSNLADAYKKSELDPESGLGIYYLSSIPTDRAEPSEGLRATTVFQTGLPDAEILLSSRQIPTFLLNGQVSEEVDVRAHRGAYLAKSCIEIDANQSFRWQMVASLNQDQTDVINRKHLIRTHQDIDQEIQQDIDELQENLLQILSCNDGRQQGDDALRVHRHQSNVLFNVMRGGTPAFGYLVNRSDFTKHVKHFNAAVYERNQKYLAELPDQLRIDQLLQRLSDQNEPDLLRIGLEYLPLGFSRRHGDPTRPWNLFEIRLKDEQGNPDLNYQGNWRDIFQNWEALSFSWPRFAQNMVFRFLNASTADGYNPYRVTKNGVEWEAPDPDDPWANIGYWGDHQIVYLLMLLERTRNYDPQQLDQWLDAEYCTYSQVPYRIRSYEEIRQNPRESIDFDFDLAKRIESRVRDFGSDGKLLQNRDGGVYRATMGEKLLVPALAKMTNFVPEGGIWLNTQRPEWNDANNALAGYGLSMVTVCYLRRYLAFLNDWFASLTLPQFLVSTDIVALMQQIEEVLKNHLPGAQAMTDQQRMEMVEGLSLAGSVYRETLYERGLAGEKVYLRVADCRDWFATCLQHLDHTIKANRREDGLFHSYNLVGFNDQHECRVEHLFEMLEGQVAVLSSGQLTAAESANLLDALRQSKMYREDQNSYLLYPNRALPRFDEKNAPAGNVLEKSDLVAALTQAGDRSLVTQDVHHQWHFNGDFRNADDLTDCLNKLSEDVRFGELAKQDRTLIEEAFEQTFGHRYFTGRSGTFFGYEGLGSIYWHMVSKLSLAAQECLLNAIGESANLETIAQLRNQYIEIREGTGIKKNPRHYGAFPTDPYSHTPQHAGAQQPGMTGQVKEDVIARLAEVGLRIRHGVVSFDPVLFESIELLQSPSQLQFFDVSMEQVTLPLEAGTFAFTVCQVPVVYRESQETFIHVHFSSGEIVTRSGSSLTPHESRTLFDRNGEITQINLEYSPRDFQTF